MADIDHFRIGGEIALPELYALCKDSLCDISRILNIDIATTAQSPARGLIQSLQNAQLAMNCFVIYTKHSNEQWRMRYLGETEVQRAGATLSSCLLPASTRQHPVNAKLNEALRTGCKAGLRMIHVEPATLRHFIQEKMVLEMQSDGVLDWHAATSAKNR